MEKNAKAGLQWHDPYRRFSWLSLIGVLLLLGLIKFLFRELDWLLALIGAVNLVTFWAYGYDKAIAGSDRMRIPERILLWLAFLGGSFGAVMGMWLFRHKTAKGSFRIKFAVVILLQLTLVGLYIYWRKIGW